MKYQIIITPSAKADIFETNTWLLENHPEMAAAWLFGLSESIMSLTKFPSRCPISAESEVFEVRIRQQLYGKKPNVYRVLFSIRAAQVFILRVRSTKQKRMIDETD